LLGSAARFGTATSHSKPPSAQSEPIKMVPCAMTGPSSAADHRLQSRRQLAADAINAAGGVKGRKMRSSSAHQGDPTKAVTPPRN